GEGPAVGPAVPFAQGEGEAAFLRHLDARQDVGNQHELVAAPRHEARIAEQDEVARVATAAGEHGEAAAVAALLPAVARRQVAARPPGRRQGRRGRAAAAGRGRAIAWFSYSFSASEDQGGRVGRLLRAPAPGFIVARRTLTGG